MSLVDGFRTSVSRRLALKAGGAALLAATAEWTLVDKLAWLPTRPALAAGTPSDIQHDIGAFIAPAFSRNGVRVQFGPVFTGFITARLTRTPSTNDQAIFNNALATIEQFYPWSPSGIFTFVSYSVDYFNRLGGFGAGTRPNRFVPRLRANTSRFALERSVASPTDVTRAANGAIVNNRAMRRFIVPLTLENNEVLITMRSDSTDIINDVFGWLQGDNTLNGRFVPSPSNRSIFSFTSARLMFQQIGLPRQVAAANNLPFTGRIQPDSPMWMGFADQQTDSSGPAAITTFLGNASARVTNATAGSYFDNGSIQHLSHVLLDLRQFYVDGTPPEEPGDDVREPFDERLQYMFEAPPQVQQAPDDPFRDGGGPRNLGTRGAFLPNVFRGAGYARQSAQQFARIGHTSALHRSGRTTDGRPVHLRIDGPGFDAMDTTTGRNTPKLQFSGFFPSADFFSTLRRNQAALDLLNEFDLEEEDHGLERFITATRRQNYMIPPRRHRAFPLIEFV
ncbi:MAG TPA: hypothetical protein VIC57_01455 [Candidatus Dormibacteraeota bacterium]